MRLFYQRHPHHPNWIYIPEEHYQHLCDTDWYHGQYPKTEIMDWLASEGVYVSEKLYAEFVRNGRPFKEVLSQPYVVRLQKYRELLNKLADTNDCPI